MKKILKILLVGILASTLVACQSEEIDAVSIYQEARANMEALDSYTMETAMVMSVSGEDEDGSAVEISIPIDMTYILVGLTTDESSEYYSVSANFLGTESSIEGWFVDGVCYIDEDDYKYKYTAEDIEITSVDIFTYIDETEAITGVANEEGYTLELNIEGSTFMEIMSALSEGSTSELFADVTIDDTVTITMEVDGDGYITSVSVAVTIELTDVGTLDMTADFTYYDFDSATLPEFDADSFIDYSTSYDTVYGDYDLTTDYAEALIAAGYEDMGDYLYYNGTYIIDLELKQIYSADALYDWEYDQGIVFDEDFNLVCSYDFINDEGDEDCDATSMQELREAYNELASSILEEE